MHATYLKYPKGKKIIKEGKNHLYFYLILNGVVKSYYQKDSKEVCQWFAFENEIISTIKTFEGKPSNETIILLKESELIQFRLEPIIELSRIDLSISHLITTLMTEHALILDRGFINCNS